MEIFSLIVAAFFEHWELVLLFFIVATLYASVGFGGGSSYLAILANTTIPFVQFRAIALLCNIVVVSSGSTLFIRRGLLPWKKVVPLVLFSVPLAFLGGRMAISQKFFFIVLGITLILAAFAMFFSKNIVDMSKALKPSFLRDGLFGGSIGFLSGMVGIGGGIFLAPLLHLTKWDNPKRIAATTSFFILVNSIAGLIGQITSNVFIIDWSLAILFLMSVLLGGLLGANVSMKRISAARLKQLTAVLIVIVGVRLLIK